MVKAVIHDPREDSIEDMWLFIIVAVTILVFLINILSVKIGTTDVAAHLLYLPIVFAAYWYPNKGMLYAFIVSAIYFSMIYLITGGDPFQMVSALIKCVVFVGVAAVVSSLAILMQKSETKYRGIFDNSEAGTGLIDKKSLSIIEANQHFASMLGYTTDEMPHVSFPEIWTDSGDRERFFAQLDKLGSIGTMETKLTTKESGIRWVLLSAGILPDDQFVCTIVDITDRKKAEEELLIKDHAIRSSINAIAMFDLGYRITFVNESLLRTMGTVKGSDFIGHPWSEYVNSEKSFSEIKAALSGKGSWLGEVILQKPDKTPFYVMLWANIVKDDKDSPVCIMVSFIDITERKQMEMSQRRALEQIEKNIEQFAILGDHIRNPLTVIVGLASIAAEEIADRIIAQAKEIDAIITRLDMGWIESEKVREFIKRYYQVGATEIEASPPPAQAPDDIGIYR
jgi:PAS domain S-box-containing protein